MNETLEVIDLGRRGYLETLELQRALRLERLDGRQPNDILLLVEHEPTYTLGRGTRTSSLPVSPDVLILSTRAQGSIQPYSPPLAAGIALRKRKARRKRRAIWGNDDNSQL